MREEQLARLLSEAIDKYGGTVRVAKDMGVSPSTVSKWKSRGSMSLQTFRALCELLKIDPDTFFTPTPPDATVINQQLALVLRRLGRLDERLDRLERGVEAASSAINLLEEAIVVLSTNPVPPRNQQPS